MNLLSWKLAYRNLLRNLRRSVATGIAILAGYVGLVLLGAYLISTQNGTQASSIYLNHKGHVAVLKKNALGYYFSKPKKYILKGEEVVQVDQILQSRKKDIEFTGKYLSGMGLISNGRKTIPFVALGFEPQVYQKVFTHPVPLKWAKDWVIREEGDQFDDFIKNPQLVSITARIAQLLGVSENVKSLSVEQASVQLAGKNFFNDLNAVNASLGRIHTTGSSLSEDTSMRAPLSLLQQLYATDGIEYLAIFLKDVGQTASFAKWLRAEVLKANLAVEVYTYNEPIWNDYYVGTMGFMKVMFSIFVLLICGAVILSVVNSTTMGLLERLTEIGTLRAIGFDRRQVTYLFVQEVFILTAFSVLSGSLISVLISSSVNSANIKFSPPGAEGAIQFLLSLDTSLGVGVAVFMFILTLVSTAIVCEVKNRAKIIDLLSDAGA